MSYVLVDLVCVFGLAGFHRICSIAPLAEGQTQILEGVRDTYER
jgi:hypothetical protein